MGHGASTEHEHQPEGHRYFCHACSRGFITRVELLILPSLDPSAML
jgi:hypothetical protein